MTTALDTYLGWETPQHFADCKRPMWSVDFRTAEKDLRPRHGGEAHSCPNDACEHGDWLPLLTVRIICSSCQVATRIRAEGAGLSQGMTATTTWGYGLPPRRVAGLLLWPGEPFFNYGRLGTEEPYDLVVTRLGVKQVTEADVVGSIVQIRGKRGAVLWSAAALPSPKGEYGVGHGLHWSIVSPQDTRMLTTTAAARWIAAQLADRETPDGAA